MFTVLRAALTAGVLMVGSFPAFAQSSPIPDSPVPGIGGRDPRPAPDTAEAPPTRPLIGLSREIPVR
jgi:hypothetical protein